MTITLIVDAATASGAEESARAKAKMQGYVIVKVTAITQKKRGEFSVRFTARRAG